MPPTSTVPPNGLIGARARGRGRPRRGCDGGRPSRPPMPPAIRHHDGGRRWKGVPPDDPREPPGVVEVGQPASIGARGRRQVGPKLGTMARGDPLALPRRTASAPLQTSSTSRTYGHPPRSQVWISTVLPPATPSASSAAPSPRRTFPPGSDPSTRIAAPFAERSLCTHPDKQYDLHLAGIPARDSQADSNHARRRRFPDGRDPAKPPAGSPAGKAVDERLTRLWPRLRPGSDRTGRVAAAFSRRTRA